MLIIYGTRLMGSTDRVEMKGGAKGGRRQTAFHVATKFFHVFFLPIFPCSSHLVLDFLPGERKRCVEIPTNLKSILLAWFRAVSWIAAFYSCVGLISEPGWASGICLAVAVVTAPVLTWHRFFTHASHDRAVELLSCINGGATFEASMRRMIDASLASQRGDDDGELEELSLPMVTADLVLEEEEEGSPPPMAVASASSDQRPIDVAQPVLCMEPMKNEQADGADQRGTEVPMTIV